MAVPHCEGKRHCPSKDLWWCVDCGARFCDDCWDNQISHQNGRTNWHGFAHEKINPRIQEMLKTVFNPVLTAEEVDRLHEDDEETTWFGRFQFVI
jgi:hypothetical protein